MSASVMVPPTAVSSRHALAEALACLLPEPLLPGDIESPHSPKRAACSPPAEAILVLGPLGRREAMSPAAAHLPVRYRFRAVPPGKGVRALLPADAEAREGRVLLRPRVMVPGRVHRGARALLRALPPVVLRHASTPITLATNRRSEFSEALRELSPAGRLGFYLGNRANTGRPAVHVFEPGGTVSLVGKFVRDPAGRERQRKEHDALTMLSRFPALTGTVPRAFGRVDGHSGSMLITDAFSGDPGPPTLTPVLRDWLRLCARGGTIPIAASGPVRRVRERLNLSRCTSPIAHRGFARALDGIGMLRVPLTVVHGDLAPWNILYRSGRPQVFDWEYACPDGVAGWDELVFTIQVGLVQHGWSASGAFDVLDRRTKAAPPPYRPGEYRCLVLLVMLDLLLRSHQAEHAETLTHAIELLAASR